MTDSPVRKLITKVKLKKEEGWTYSDWPLERLKKPFQVGKTYSDWPLDLHNKEYQGFQEHLSILEVRLQHWKRVGLIQISRWKNFKETIY